MPGPWQPSCRIASIATLIPRIPFSCIKRFSAVKGDNAGIAFDRMHS
jgi:hypothetical protein